MAVANFYVVWLAAEATPGGLRPRSPVTRLQPPASVHSYSCINLVPTKLSDCRRTLPAGIIVLLS